MAAIAQPFLDTPSPRPRPSHLKILYLVLAIVSSTAILILSFQLIQTKSQSTPPFSFHICDTSHDPRSCIAEIASNPGAKANGADLVKVFLEKSTPHIQDFIDKAKKVKYRFQNSARDERALVDCVELMELSMDRIMGSIQVLEVQSFAEAHAWLSSVLTNHVTCFDGLDGLSRSMMEPNMKNLISRARTSLAILVAVSPTKDDTVIEPLKGDLPSWVTSRDRKLLESAADEIKANIVVAKDGSGNYRTVKEAVAAAPNKSKTRYIIHVKKGTYKENVEIGKNKNNLMLVGDGMDSTIITGSLNVVDGSTTFKSATLAVVGDGFMAQDIWFQNTAGPQKHQAVALRVSADHSVINRCRIEAYQDTLYTHSLRQFYRDCYITGTVDFIFGNAAVVFQKCKIVARKPMSNQANMVTAQGRVDPNQNTGTSIQQCDIIASADLEPVKGSIKSYLGRPWKEYSRTVVMQSYIGDHIDPTGWSPWDKDFALKTLYYGEYINKGPGAGTRKRVKWPGYHVITSATEAHKFTVAELIQGGSWLKSTGVAYVEGL